MIEYHERPFILSEFKIEVTHRCGLNCVHCSSDARPSNVNEMSREGCLRILGEAATIGAKQVAFSGGEPFCWPYIFDAVESAAKNDLSITIYTSGNVESFKQKAKSVAGLGAQRLIFSLFGGTPTSHERVTRIAGSFDQTLFALQDANSIGLNTEIHFVPMSTNYRELRNIAILAKSHGASVVSVLRLVPQGRAALLHGRILSRVQNLELRRHIRSLREEGYIVRTGSPYNFLMMSDSPKCCAAIDRLIIGPDLHVYPCDAFKQVGAAELVDNGDFSSLNGTGLEECWERSPYLEAIRAYLTTPFGAPCDSCELLERCLSGCLAQKVVIHGNLDKRADPDCLRGTLREDQI